jgi:hypothetical protein
MCVLSSGDTVAGCRGITPPSGRRNLTGAALMSFWTSNLYKWHNDAGEKVAFKGVEDGKGMINKLCNYTQRHNALGCKMCATYEWGHVVSDAVVDGSMCCCLTSHGS